MPATLNWNLWLGPAPERAYNSAYQFPKRGKMAACQLTWYDGGLPTDWRTGWKLLPEKQGRAYGQPPKQLDRSPRHHREFVIAAKGGKQADSNFDWAGPMTEAVLLGNVALRAELREHLTKKRLQWDVEKDGLHQPREGKSVSAP